MWDRLSEISRRYQSMNGCHGYEHTERVVKLCAVLGEKKGANMDVLIPAAILHDIKRSEQSHARVGAIEAEKILRELDYNEDVITQVGKAIRVHSFSEAAKADSIEAQILSDADKLDAIGAIGIYRTANYSGERDRPLNEFINHFHEKLLTLRDLLYTDEAKLMAEERNKFMIEYLEQLSKELKAEI